MDVVPVARSVRPGRRLETLGAEASLVRSARVRHRRVRTGQIATDTPITVPTVNVTTAAAAPIPTWRAPEKAAVRPVSRLTPAPTPDSAPARSRIAVPRAT